MLRSRATAGLATGSQQLQRSRCPVARGVVERSSSLQPALSSKGRAAPSRSPLLVCRAAGGNHGKDIERAVVEAAVAVPDDDVDTPFLEPAVRSFALGVGAGVLLEVAHVLTQFTSFATAAGETLPRVLPEVLESLAPLVAWDNLLAVTCCALFYGMEVSAILPVLREHPNDSKQAAKLITNLPTLPKRLMPVKLVSVKRAIYALIALRNPAAALAQSSPFLDSHDGGDTAARTSSGGSSRGGVGTAVLDRPTAAPAPPLGAPGGALPPFPKAAAPPATLPPRTRPTWDKKRTSSPPPMARDVGTKPEQQRKGRDGLAPGAWDPAQPLPDSRRAKELRERRAYLRNFWYAAALSSQVAEGQVKEVQMLGRTVALFRDEAGKVRCLDNICPHRGAPLGKGWTKEVQGHTCVVCPYHGWAFNGDGKLVDAPSSADQSRLPKRSLVDAYPVEEQGGFIYLFFGSSSMPAAERPPLPSSFCPELFDPAWQPVYGEMEFTAPHWSVFDNALDMAHIHYLHSDSFGNSSKPVVMDMEMKRDTWGISGTFRIHNKPVNALWEWTAVDSVPVEYKAFLPSTSCIKITLGSGVQMITFVNTTPIDANRAVNRFCLVRNFAGWEGFDVWARNAMFKILGEDKVMVEVLKPESMRTEVSLEADLPQIAFRKLRQEWVDMGYCVDPELTEKHTGTLDM